MELKQYFNKADEKFSFTVGNAVVTLSKKGDEKYLTDAEYNALPKNIKDKLTLQNPLNKDKKIEVKK